MNVEVFKTHALPHASQYDAWRDRFGPVMEVVAAGNARAGFAAENHVRPLGRFAVSRVVAPPVRVTRGKQHFRRDHVDHWALLCCRAGETRIETSRGSRVVAPGVPFLWSLGTEFASERSHVDRLQIYLPRDAFPEIAPALDAICGSPLEGGLGRLLADFLFALQRELPALAPEDVTRLAPSLGAMVAACIAPNPDRVAEAARPIAMSRMERTRRAVRLRLRSPDLTPAMLATELGLSRSNLYRLFEGSDGVAAYIQRHRLLEAYRELADPANERPVNLIAADLCFVDPSSFSRAFRREFGQTPTEVRSATRGLPESQFGARPWPMASGANFGEWLRSA